jgi:hypothetical protein
LAVLLGACAAGSVGSIEVSDFSNGFFEGGLLDGEGGAFAFGDFFDGPDSSFH